MVAFLTVCALCLVAFGLALRYIPASPPASQPPKIDQSAWVYTSAGVALQSIKHSLKDADSAKFRSVGVIVPDRFDPAKVGVVCGEVNAKNSFGGYTGFKQFVMVPAGIAIDGANPEFSRLWNAQCAGKPIRYLPDDHLPD